MSKRLILSLSTLLTFIGITKISAEETTPPPFYPFSVNTDYIWVHNADFRTPGIEEEHLHFTQTNAAFAYTHPFNTYWGLVFGAGYTGNTVDWKQNPDFDETHFSYVNFSFGGYTKSFPCWTWTATVNALMDTEVLDLSNYALYQGVLLGDYELCEGITLDVGFIIEVGLHKEKIWPIFGFEFAPWHGWKLDFVYPLDMSLTYTFCPEFNAGISGRFLRSRHRLKESAPLSMGIFEYHTSGIELDATYLPVTWFFVKAFVGSTFNGDLKMTDRNNHDAVHYKFKGSFYAGASALASY